MTDLLLASGYFLAFGTVALGLLLGVFTLADLAYERLTGRELLR